MIKSKIEWTESTWNPITGCTKVSPGCLHCYAERMAYRLQSMGNKNYVNGFNLSIHEHLLNVPLQWKKPKIIFVNSMSDLFHADVSADFISRVFRVMNFAKQHIFQVLTKRSERLLELAPYLPWSDNIWMGVSVENMDYAHRIEHLSLTAAKVKFLSLEPLLGPLPNLPLEEIDWVIVGGESGPGARPMEEAWVRDIRDQCRRHDVAFFFKQWGGTNKKKAGRKLEGRVWSEMPATPGQEACLLHPR
ncbi:MAG: DUF5131 family protein [Desulfovibrio aminophilus]|jgi:Bacteriophage protein gp37|uniref:DUF5131 family protein n=1 Tax=Desulfovibrio aminophilus TaxID=81425 RepID=UPI002A3A1EAD|nr:phage Gp37/Gp68 family protein [Desulfovibrionaceae bacterium]